MIELSRRLGVVSSIAAIVTALAACQADSPTTFTRSLTPNESPRFSTYDPSTRTLGLNLSAGPRFTGDTYRTARVSVIGGNGTYYYEWYQQPCFGTWCADQYLNGAGWGLDSSSFHLTSDMSWVKITVQAFDSPDLPYSASTTVTLIGPAPQTTHDKFKCELGFDNYPIHNIYPDSGGRYSAYYRDGCTGGRVYDPDHPKLPWEEF